MTIIKSIIAGSGSYLPEKIMTNADMEKIVDTTDEWIFQRSGIRERRVAAPEEMTSDMAIKAAISALADAGMDAQKIDGIIVATTTPDSAFPAVAVRVQAALGIPMIPAFDVQAACSGFIYAMSTADAFIRAGGTHNTTARKTRNRMSRQGKNSIENNIFHLSLSV